MIMEMAAILLTFVLLACTSGVSARGSIDFRLGATFRLTKVSRPSPNKVTANVLTLERSGASSQSSEYLTAIRQGSPVDGVYSRVQVRRFPQSTMPTLIDMPLQIGNTPIQAVLAGSVYLAPITVGGQDFNVVIDTGSSDTWLIDSNFECIDPDTGSTRDESACKFGPAYIISPTANIIPDQNFNISYADGEFLNGDMLYENITLANITVSQQEMGLVDYAAWNGDSISSGLVGLAYPILTNAYSGSDPEADTGSTYINYDPIFTTMYKREQTLPVFSIATQRASANSAQSNGGVLALGGIPNIPHNLNFVSAAIEISSIDSDTGANVYQFYTIDIDGWAYSNDSSVIFDTFNVGSNERYTPLDKTGTNMIVDSGTSLIYAPAAVAQAVAALYSPAATFSSSYGVYTVPCGAIPPVFGVVVQRKILYINPVDMVIQAGAGLCVPGVQGDGGGHTILGDVFMRNVLTVFDVGAAEVRFAAREFEDAIV